MPSGLRVRSGSKYDEDYDGQPLSRGVAELGDARARSKLNIPALLFLFHLFSLALFLLLCFKVGKQILKKSPKNELKLK